MLGEEQGRAWLTNLGAITTHMTRFPSAIERAMETAARA